MLLSSNTKNNLYKCSALFLMLGCVPIFFMMLYIFRPIFMSSYFLVYINFTSDIRWWVIYTIIILFSLGMLFLALANEDS